MRASGSEADDGGDGYLIAKYEHVFEEVDPNLVRLTSSAHHLLRHTVKESLRSARIRRIAFVAIEVTHRLSKLAVDVSVSGCGRVMQARADNKWRGAELFEQDLICIEVLLQSINTAVECKLHHVCSWSRLPFR
jgi:hypothetical protein